MPTSTPSSHGAASPNPKQTPPKKKRLPWPVRAIFWVLGLAVAGMVAGAFVVAIALSQAYPNLPDISDLVDYQPKLPLRVYSSEGVLIGEFGEERRTLTPIREIPKVMVDAVLAIEDTRFFEHNGVDYKGILRAALANLGKVKSQGASTITMQVARNVYLSSEKTYTRKIYEVLLTFKLEHLLSKEKILEVYMNQIFLGHRAYGFAAAAEVYFGKQLNDLSIAEAAMLAGLPKAPPAYNPISNPKLMQMRDREHLMLPAYAAERFADVVADFAAYPGVHFVEHEERDFVEIREHRFECEKHAREFTAGDGEPERLFAFAGVRRDVEFDGVFAGGGECAFFDVRAATGLGHSEFAEVRFHGGIELASAFSARIRKRLRDAREFRFGFLNLTVEFGEVRVQIFETAEFLFALGAEGDEAVELGG